MLWNDWEMGRFTEVWGPDAADFKPSRWISEGQLKKESPFKFHAFNGGHRLCLGTFFLLRRFGMGPHRVDAGSMGLCRTNVGDIRSHRRFVGRILCSCLVVLICDAFPVMGTIVRDFDLSIAPGYLESVEMLSFEKTPRYRDTLTLPMVNSFSTRFHGMFFGLTPSPRPLRSESPSGVASRPRFESHPA